MPNDLSNEFHADLDAIWADVQGFINALIRAYGGHATPATLRALATWQRMEGGSTNNPDKFNFLNTTQHEPGSYGTGNVDGVQAYNSFQQGLAATIQTLNNGRYPAIVAALRTGNWAPTPELAHDLRTWSGGGYSSILGAANGTAPPNYGGGSGSPSTVTPPLPGQPVPSPLATQAQASTQALTALRALLATAPARVPTVNPGFTPLTAPAASAPAPVAAFSSALLTGSFGAPLAALTNLAR